jgi:CO dehydrogenase nickel-insertion accessory protein CooC1
MNGNNQNSLAGKKIGFFGKGGAGKSTAVVLIARALVKAGYTVCIVDADSTNVGLHQALGIEQPPSPLIDYYRNTVAEVKRFVAKLEQRIPPHAI